MEAVMQIEPQAADPVVLAFVRHIAKRLRCGECGKSANFGTMDGRAYCVDCVMH
jgi:hypothetical protein